MVLFFNLVQSPLHDPDTVFVPLAGPCPGARQNAIEVLRWHAARRVRRDDRDHMLIRTIHDTLAMEDSFGVETLRIGRCCSR